MQLFQLLNQNIFLQLVKYIEFLIIIMKLFVMKILTTKKQLYWFIQKKIDLKMMN